MRVLVLVFFHLLISFVQLNAQSLGNLAFQSTEIDIGTVYEDDGEVKALFTYTNISDFPIFITSVEITCRCAIPSYSKRAVLPREQGVIVVNFTPKGYPGELRRSLFVYTSLSPDEPTAILKISGFVNYSRY